MLRRWSMLVLLGRKKTMKLLDGDPARKGMSKKRKRNHKKNAVNPPFQTLKEVMVAQLTLGLKISFINWISFVALFFFHVLLEWCLVFCFHPSAATHICQTKCVDWISRNGENRHLVCQTAFIHGLWQIMKSYIPSIATKGLDVSNFFQQIGMLKPTWKSRSIIATHLPTRRDNTSSIPLYPQVRWLRVPQLPLFLTCHRGQRCFLCSQQPRTGKGHCTERTANLTMAKRWTWWASPMEQRSTKAKSMAWTMKKPGKIHIETKQETTAQHQYL